MNKQVYIVVHHHRYGHDMYIHSTKEGAERRIALIEKDNLREIKEGIDWVQLVEEEIGD